METTEQLKNKRGLRHGKIERFTLGLSNYEAEETQDEHEGVHKNMLGHNQIPPGIQKYSDLLYVAEARHVYFGGAQGGASTETNQPVQDRFIPYTIMDTPHYPVNSDRPNPNLRFFSKKPANGKIWQTGSTHVDATSPTYNGHIINADETDKPGYIVFGPYYVMQAGGPLHLNSYFYIGNLEGVPPGQVLLRLEVGYQTNNGWVDLVKPAVFTRSQVKDDGDAMYTTIRMATPSNAVHGVEQRIYFYGVGYFEFYQNWCYRPR
ncbi:MAG: hypothetical protein V4649_18560 [Bacteroidota bacterium]